MKVLLVGINAKYIHTNPAIQFLKIYAEKNLSISIETAEFTINQTMDFILREIYKAKPDVLGFSCYIWNWEIIKQILVDFHKVLPSSQIILGGPEISYDSEKIIQSLPVSYIIRGEGEIPFVKLMEALQKEDKDFTCVPSLTYRKHNQVVSNAPAKPVQLEKIPFLYKDLTEYQNRILYYESSRGCPYRCSYCLSAMESNLTFLPLERVYADLNFFLKQKVRQVKFIDRTFNANKKHALSIWKYLHKHDNGISNFHFEITAELLDKEMLTFLQTVRKGLFQFEIGVQSTNPQTLQAIHRPCNFEKLANTVKALQTKQNIHLHLDLIIGLPYESYEQFRQSFNDVYALQPDQFQVGFLKMLKGSTLRYKQKQYGIVFKGKAPYEVLYTEQITYQEMLRLKMIEEMVERYYNSCRYSKAVEYLISFFKTPFDFYEQLSVFYEEHGYHTKSHSKEEYYTILYAFFTTISNEDTRFQWLVKYDIYSHEKANRIPKWLKVDITKQNQQSIVAFYQNPVMQKQYLYNYKNCDSKLASRISHVEIFPFHPIKKTEEATVLLFDYREKDILGNAFVHEIKLNALFPFENML